MVVYRAGRKPAQTSRGHMFHDALAHIMRRHVMGGGHVMRHDVERVHDETSGIGLGLSRHRDGVGTRRGTSHNSIPGCHPGIQLLKPQSYRQIYCS